MPEPRPLLLETFQKVQALFWVLSYTWEPAGPFDWVLSQIEPAQVPNGSMRWRRPTYEECVERQAVYDADPKGFLERAAERSRTLRPYVHQAMRETVRQARLAVRGG